MPSFELIIAYRAGHVDLFAIEHVFDQALQSILRDSVEGIRNILCRQSDPQDVLLEINHLVEGRFVRCSIVICKELSKELLHIFSRNLRKCTGCG